MGYKRKSYRPKKYVPRRKKSYRKGSSRGARKQQKAAMTWIRKKYTKVFVMEVPADEIAYERTISLIGGKNTQNDGDTITLFDVNQDNQLRTDMTLYQFFRIRGVAIKMFFPMPTDVASSPVQWTCAYSANEILAPKIEPERV